VGQAEQPGDVAAVHGQLELTHRLAAEGHAMRPVQQEAGQPYVGRDHGVYIAQFLGAGVLQA
jgi:hypothetical protein